MASLSETQTSQASRPPRMSQSIDFIDASDPITRLKDSQPPRKTAAGRLADRKKALATTDSAQIQSNTTTVSVVEDSYALPSRRPPKKQQSGAMPTAALPNDAPIQGCGSFKLKDKMLCQESASNRASQAKKQKSRRKVNVTESSATKTFGTRHRDSTQQARRPDSARVFDFPASPITSRKQVPNSKKHRPTNQKAQRRSQRFIKNKTQDEPERSAEVSSTTRAATATQQRSAAHSSADECLSRDAERKFQPSSDAARRRDPHEEEVGNARDNSQQSLNNASQRQPLHTSSAGRHDCAEPQATESIEQIPMNTGLDSSECEDLEVPEELLAEAYEPPTIGTEPSDNLGVLLHSNTSVNKPTTSRQFVKPDNTSQSAYEATNEPSGCISASVQGHAKQAALMDWEETESLVDIEKAKRSSIISFDRHGPRNQGQLPVGRPLELSSMKRSVVRRPRVTDEYATRTSPTKPTRLRLTYNANKTTKSSAANARSSAIPASSKPSSLRPILKNSIWQRDEYVSNGRRGTIFDDDDDGIALRSSPLQSRSQQPGLEPKPSALHATGALNPRANKCPPQRKQVKPETDHERRPAKRLFDDANLEAFSKSKRFKASATREVSPSPLQKDGTLNHETTKHTLPSQTSLSAKNDVTSEVDAPSDKCFDTLRAALEHGHHEQSPRLILRSNRKSHPPQPDQPSQVITGSATTEQVDEANAAFDPTVIEDPFSSPAGSNITQSPFVQRMLKLIRQQEADEALFNTGMSNEIDLIEDDGTELSEDEPETPCNSEKRATDEFHHDQEPWVSILDPALLKMHGVLQNITRYMIHNLAEAVNHVEELKQEWNSAAVSLLRLLEESEARRIARHIKNEENGIRNLAQQQVITTQKMCEEVNRMAVADTHEQWREPRPVVNDILRRLNRRLYDGDMSQETGVSYGNDHF